MKDFLNKYIQEPAEYESIHIRIEPDLKQELSELSENMNMSMNRIVSIAIMHLIDSINEAKTKSKK